MIKVSARLWLVVALCPALPLTELLQAPRNAMKVWTDGPTPGFLQLNAPSFVMLRVLGPSIAMRVCNSISNIPSLELTDDVSHWYRARVHTSNDLPRLFL